MAGLILGTAGLAAAAPAPRRPAPSRAPARKPAPKPAVKPRPVINLTATTLEPRRAQIRLATFIHAVQIGSWARAATCLSSRVTPAERQRLVSGPWLRPAGRNDFANLLYMPRIEIRTISFEPDQARLRVLPYRWEHTRGQAYGVWDVTMLREGGRWLLNIHP
jgi:hypothetical protein